MTYGLLVVMALMFLGCESQEEVLSTPNVIYINVDDLGWKDVGFMGSDFYETPNIDQLAANGMTFTQGYAAAANCAPSRACLMSGQNTPRHGVYTVGSSERGDGKTRKLIPIENTDHLADSVFTMADLFKKAGYTTGTFGKWHVTKNPLQNGFDVNIGGDERGNPGKGGYTAPYNELPNLKVAADGENLTDRLTDECIAFITDNKSKPFFVYLPYYAVHTPLMGKENLIAKYKEKQGKKEKQNSGYYDKAVYAAMIENVDTNIGRLLKTLDRLQLTKNTMIVFTSDNGGIRAISRQDPLRAGKGSYYEGGTRVPYIIKWTHKIKAGTKNTTPITNLDFLPTFAELVNIDVSSKVLDGVNILPLLKGERIAERNLYWHFPVYLQAYSKGKDGGRDPLFRTRPGSTILADNWKLHHYFEDNSLELYNLSTDLGEQDNLITTHPKKAKELFRMLDIWRTKMNAPIPNRINPNYDSEFEFREIEN
ncbi:sulfatase [Maribacter polysaccharolyticus]|uniref:sulfatase n=1 Tax=Maribacter polysaccharolyticus TaxID=3020831 RepID=UPI00237F320B|nr:sulfatase [Maribacter polysaccharolyticus]MDE3741798.1 sulfatase [Maribacter polysaccharolyticus]